MPMYLPGILASVTSTRVGAPTSVTNTCPSFVPTTRGRVADDDLVREEAPHDGREHRIGDREVAEEERALRLRPDLFHLVFLAVETEGINSFGAGESADENGNVVFLTF